MKPNQEEDEPEVIITEMHPINKVYTRLLAFAMEWIQSEDGERVEYGNQIIHKVTSIWDGMFNSQIRSYNMLNYKGQSRQDNAKEQIDNLLECMNDILYSEESDYDKYTFALSIYEEVRKVIKKAVSVASSSFNNHPNRITAHHTPRPPEPPKPRYRRLNL